MIQGGSGGVRNGGNTPPLFPGMEVPGAHMNVSSNLGNVIVTHLPNGRLSVSAEPNPEYNDLTASERRTLYDAAMSNLYNVSGAGLAAFYRTHPHLERGKEAFANVTGTNAVNMPMPR